MHILLASFFSALFFFSSTTYAQDNNEIALEDLQVFSEVFNTIRSQYIEEVSDHELFESAIAGMLNNLDAHSSYLNREELAQLIDETQGEFVGIGVELEKNQELLIILNVIHGSPADKAGLSSGDTILQINETITDQLGLDEAAQLIKGKEGSKVTLNILSAGATEAKKVRLTRSPVVIPNVDFFPIDNGYAYIRIHQFQDNTAQQIKDVLENKQSIPFKGIIFDVRDNPGGLLTSVVDVVDLFLRDGLIVYTQGRGKYARQEYLASPTHFNRNSEIAILINQHSASAAEIMAGALQDRQRAIVVGEKSFGKGSVQTIIPITEDRAIKLTTNLYYTPSGKVININGIRPDIEQTSKDTFKLNTSTAPNFTEDLQLQAALNAIKGSILQRQKESDSFLVPVE